MTFNFKNLTPTVRQRMVGEIQAATTGGRLYISPKRLTGTGKVEWSGLLIQAAGTENEHWLAHQLENRDLVEDEEIRRKPKGGYTRAFIPHTGSETLSDGEFNRYYMIAVCQEAIALGKTQVSVYRAKERGTHRPESDALLGKVIDPQQLIAELRPLPAGKPHELLNFNSGLSISFEN
jgi:hypothetical protein